MHSSEANSVELISSTGCSWLRTVRGIASRISGYNVIFVPFSGGETTAEAVVDVLTGLSTAEGNALGRPGGVALNKM